MSTVKLLGIPGAIQKAGERMEATVMLAVQRRKNVPLMKGIVTWIPNVMVA